VRYDRRGMKLAPKEIPDVILIEPDVHRDARGFFLETWHQRKYAEGGISGPFVQDNHSHSRRGALRGLHAQLRRPQGKLVRVVDGEVFDVAVDIRRGSPTFGKWVGDRLTGENLRQLWIPPGFAHGFYVVSERVHLEYKCTDFYDASDEIAIAWNDPEIGVRWPVSEPTLSAKDAAAPRLAEVLDRLPTWRG
jgi:dTDP-4-dehydrorhamnose 3,5-epimerase